MKKTLIISAYDCCGKTYAFEHYHDEFSILDLLISDFFIEKRKRTKEELEKLKEEWIAEEHLMSADGYINQVKNQEVVFFNQKFSNNYLKYIRDNIGKVDIIFVDGSIKTRKYLTDANIDFITVLPHDSCIHEWIGKYVEKYVSLNSFIIKDFIKSTKEINQEPYGKNAYYLHHNEFMDREFLRQMIKLNC